MKGWREILGASSTIDDAPPIPPHPPKPTTATSIGGNGGKGPDNGTSYPEPAPDHCAPVDAPTPGQFLYRPRPDPKVFAARAAFLEHEPKLDRHEAETVAEREQGWADAFAYGDALVMEWRRTVETAPAASRARTCWKDLRQIAIDFLAGPVAVDAVRSGWSAKALFGVVPDGAGRCLPVGAVFRQPQEGLLFAFDSGVALYRHEDSGWHHRYITEFDTMDAIVLWEVIRPRGSG